MSKREFPVPASVRPTPRGALTADKCDGMIAITTYDGNGGHDVLVSCAEWCALCEHVEGLEPMRAYRAGEGQAA